MCSRSHSFPSLQRSYYLGQCCRIKEERQLGCFGAWPNTFLSHNTFIKAQDNGQDSWYGLGELHMTLLLGCSVCSAVALQDKSIISDRRARPMSSSLSYRPPRAIKEAGVGTPAFASMTLEEMQTPSTDILRLQVYFGEWFHHQSKILSWTFLVILNCFKITDI